MRAASIAGTLRNLLFARLGISLLKIFERVYNAYLYVCVFVRQPQSDIATQIE